jgi:hypothetical protein
MKSHLVIAAICATLLLFAACSKEDVYPVAYHYDYYPLQAGTWKEYAVDSITYDDNFQPVLVDTASYFLKELITGVFTDAAGDTVYRVERFRKETEAGIYQLVDVLYQSLNNDQAVRTENNLRFIQLIFPVEEEVKWQGHAQLDASGSNAYLAGWEFEIVSIHEPLAIGNLAFDSTLVVLEVDDENLIEKKYSIAHYAKGFGLVKKEFLHLQKQNVNHGWDQPEEGFILRLTIIGHG